MKNIISCEKKQKKNCWLNSAFPFILYLWIRIQIRNSDPDPWTQMNPDPTGFGSTSLIFCMKIIFSEVFHTFLDKFSSVKNYICSNLIFKIFIVRKGKTIFFYEGIRSFNASFLRKLVLHLQLHQTHSKHIKKTKVKKLYLSKK